MTNVIELAKQADELARKELKCVGYHIRWKEVRDQYLVKLVRNAALEEAANIAWKCCSPAGDEFGHGYNKSAVEIERAIRNMKDNT